MRTPFLLPLFILALLGAAAAQEQSAPDRVELFGGYSRPTFSIFDRYSGPWTRFGYNGFEASAAFNLMPHLAVEVDFADAFASPNGNSSSVRTFMGGPRIFTNIGKATVYGHFLVGGLAFSIGGSGSSYVVAGGGGASLWVSRHIGVRLIQFDYLHNGFIPAAVLGYGAGSSGMNNYRFSTGIVFRFKN